MEIKFPFLKKLKKKLPHCPGSHAEAITKKDLVEMEKRLMAKQSELAGLLKSVGDKLDEASTEILAEIEKLKQTDPDISAEGMAQLERITAKATALADIVPNNPEPPTP